MRLRRREIDVIMLGMEVYGMHRRVRSTGGVTEYRQFSPGDTVRPVSVRYVPS